MQKPEKPDWVDVAFPFGSTFFMLNCLYYIERLWDINWWLQILAVGIFYAVNLFAWTKIFNFINRKKNKHIHNFNYNRTMVLHYDSLETCMAVTFICMLFEVYYTVAYKGELPHHGKAKRWLLQYWPFNGTLFGLCLARYLEKYYEVRFLFSALIFAFVYVSLLLLMKLFVKHKRKIS